MVYIRHQGNKYTTSGLKDAQVSSWRQQIEGVRKLNLREHVSTLVARVNTWQCSFIVADTAFLDPLGKEGIVNGLPSDPSASR